MPDFNAMMSEFRASAQRYDFERQAEGIEAKLDDAFADQRRRLDRERRAVNLAHLIAERSARDDLLCHGVMDDTGNQLWLNVEHVTIAGDERDLIAIAIAVAYLDARGLIERHPRFAHLVRILQERQP